MQTSSPFFRYFFLSKNSKKLPLREPERQPVDDDRTLRVLCEEFINLLKLKICQAKLSSG